MKEIPDNKLQASIAWYRRFIAWAEGRWQRGSPSSHRLFTTFRAGVTGLLADFQDFVTVWTRLSAGVQYSQLNCREIALLRLVPRDIVRATPAIFASALPGTVLLLPVMFYFPRIFLTEHFWTEEQRREFSEKSLSRRRRHFGSVVGRLQQLQSQLSPAEAANELQLVLGSVADGTEPPTRRLAAASHAFGHDCLQFDYLTYRHAIHLSHASDISALKLYREYRLWRLAKILYEEDRAVERANYRFASCPETNKRMRDQFCIARGYLSCGQTEEAADQFVRRWCDATALVDGQQQLSFLLHLPALIGSGSSFRSG